MVDWLDSVHKLVLAKRGIAVIAVFRWLYNLISICGIIVSRAKVKNNLVVVLVR